MISDRDAVRRAEDLLAMMLRLNAKPLLPREQMLAEGLVHRDVAKFLEARGWVFNAVNREWRRLP